MKSCKTTQVGTPSRNMTIVVCCCIRAFFCADSCLGKFMSADRVQTSWLRYFSSAGTISLRIGITDLQPALESPSDAVMRGGESHRRRRIYTDRQVSDN